MLFSRVLKGSPHCVASPDGLLIATLLASSIAIRDVKTLDLVLSISLPAGLAGGVVAFTWAPSSTKILVAVLDQIQVFSAVENPFHAVIRLALSTAAKPTLVTFGATDHEVFVFSTHGIKLSIFNLTSSSTVEVANPKFYTMTAASRGFALRPVSNHLALLTRTAGKDLISIHPPGSREVQRSWTVDTIDAQGLAWTLEGNWLYVWESAAHGHRLLFYTPDGHLYKEWHGPIPRPGDVDLQLGAGISLLKLSGNGDTIAIADSSRSVTILSTATMTENFKLTHLEDICPSETLQVWQEQSASQADALGPTFTKATQTVAPPGGTGSGSSDTKTGTNLIAFDCSSTLLATRLASAPSTVWIWDLLSAELRAVIVYHSDVTQVSWHPKQAEVLLMRCEPVNPATIFIWDPLSQGPLPVDIGTRMKTRKLIGKPQVNWLNRPEDTASILFADDKSFGLCLLTDNSTDADLSGWFPHNSVYEDLDSFSSLGTSGIRAGTSLFDDDADDDHSEMDDTFHFKKFNTP